MKKCTIKELKKGDFFTLKDYGDFPDEKRVYVKDDYERSEKKYIALKYTDFLGNGSLFKGSREVYTDFIF